ncbi:MAG TPA: NAD(P)-dependent oxidoreductase [Burkholderiaceae bacterium]|nr:NAD(P)-dependent oxidoreductase [Burkholderiaceae bacterium]
MSERILLFPAIPEQVAPLAAAVRRLEPDAQSLSGFEEHAPGVLAGVEVVLGWRFPQGFAGHLTGLRWVCSMAAGVEKLLVPDLAPHVPVSRVVDAEQGIGMGQYAAAMVLRHARGLARYDVQQRERDWTRYPMAVARHQVVVLGWGEVGREVGRQFEALGFPVRGWRRDGTTLAEVLHDAQVVINTLPLTPATEALLDAAAFAALPRGAYFVNIARGGHVVEEDLIAAVRSGHLSGAALDVQRREPLPAADPLWSVPGITITPHIASQPSHEKVAEQFVTGLRCLRRGEPLPNLIDRARGY